MEELDLNVEQYINLIEAQWVLVSTKAPCAKKKHLIENAGSILVTLTETSI